MGVDGGVLYPYTDVNDCMGACQRNHSCMGFDMRWNNYDPEYYSMLHGPWSARHWLMPRRSVTHYRYECRDRCNDNSRPAFCTHI